MLVADLLALATRWRPKRTATIIDPALQGIGGHHYSAAERLAAEIAAAGVDCRILCSAKADSNVIGALKGERCFSESIYGRTDTGMPEFERRARAISKDLYRMVRWTRPDLLILPTCDQVLLYATSLCIKSIGGWQPNILAWFLYPPDSEQAQAEFRVAGASLEAVLSSRGQVHACCETMAAKRLLESCLPFPLERRPGPSALANAIAPARRDHVARSRGAIVACVGHANIGKGYALLPDALSLATTSDDSVVFRVHGFIDRRDTVQDHETFRRLSAMGPGVSVHNGVLSTQGYQEFIAAADILLLPYAPEVYRSRGSGVFNEAEQLGKPVIAPRECTFAEDAFAEGRAVPIERLDPRGIADAIAAAISGLSQLEERAAMHARKRQLDGLQPLLSRLLKAVPGPCAIKL
ncbi:glycosyltransferase [Reyranella sp.]|uniref:glycosyltransferase n=1 Tax=Reyranella sp. TaxID=1929291 RepID=UPI00403747DD